MNYNFRYFLLDIRSAKILFINNIFRSIISSLGIMVGVASIILILSISEYAKQKNRATFEKIGLNTIRIEHKKLSSLSLKKENLSSGLSYKDFQSMEQTLTKDTKISLSYKTKNITILYKNRDFTSNIFGTLPQFFYVEELHILKGRPFIEQDISGSFNNVIISNDIAKKYLMQIGDTIVVNNQLYTIIGISTIKDSINNFIVFPYTNYPIYKKHLDEISCYIDDTDLIKERSHIIYNKLLSLHNNIKDFTIVVPYIMLQKEQETTYLFSIVVLTIAIVSLLTGGISIMNIMLSNINEQTREIGLRLAIGATKKRILIQYFIHSYFLIFFGGFMGIVIGYIALFIINITTEIDFMLSMKALLSAIFMTLFSGILFGIYPAKRASEIEPMIALKEY